MAKHRHRLRTTTNHALQARLKYLTKNVPVKSIGFTMLTGLATGIAIGFLIKK
jgi:hypothetical protein